MDRPQGLLEEEMTTTSTQHRRGLSLNDVESQIKVLEEEIEQLEIKLQNIKSYEIPTANGGVTGDGEAFQRDSMRQQQINRQLTKLYAQRQQTQNQISKWSDTTRSYANKYLIKMLEMLQRRGISEKHQKAIRAAFSREIYSLERIGFWSDPARQSHAEMEKATKALFHKVYGEVILGGETADMTDAPTSVIREAGIDEDTDPPPEDDKRDDPIDFGQGPVGAAAREAYSRWQNRKTRQHTTLADRMKAEREERMNNVNRSAEATARD